MREPTKSKKNKNSFLFSLTVIAVTLFLCCAVIYFLQPSMFFFPYHDAEAYESLQATEHFEEVSIPHGKGQLHGWLRRDPEMHSAPLLILYGGNMQNSSAWFRMFENTGTFRWFRGYHVLFVDHPGYGLSDGKPTEKSLFSAALAVFDFSQTIEGTNGNTVLLGYSIGTGVATYVASHRSIEGLILLAPYDRGLSLYNDVCNIFHGPLEALARFKFDSATYAEHVSVSPLILASENDEVIPYTQAIELSQHFRNLKDLVILDGINHDGFFYSTQVLEAIQSYLSSVA